MLGLNQTVKLIDFGLSTFIVPGEKLNKKVGSLEFMVQLFCVFVKFYILNYVGTGSS